MASKYTYDNGEAPFSSSWSMPTPTKGRGAPQDKPAPEMTTATRKRKSARAAAAATASGAGATTGGGAAAAATAIGDGLGGGGGGGAVDSAAGTSSSARTAAATTGDQTRTTPGPSAKFSSAAAADSAAPGSSAAPRATAPGAKTPPVEARKDDAVGGSITGGESSDAVQNLSVEVAELRSLVRATRAALGKGNDPRAAAAVSKAAEAKDGQRDAIVRKLAREVADLRADLARLAGGDGAVGAREGGTEAVQRLSREVAELRAQLERSRKEHAMTRTALRRLKDEVDVLAVRGGDQ